MNTAKYISESEGILTMETLDSFRQKHMHSQNAFDRLVSNASHAIIDDNSATIFFCEDFFYKRISVTFDGKVTKETKKKCFCTFSERNGHRRIQLFGSSVSLERFVAVAYDIAMNQLASSYKTLAANVMDGSGNSATARELGIKTNYSPENIEWCSTGENSRHGNLIKPIYKITGHAYRFSYKDCKKIELIDPDKLKDWCRGNLHQVK